MGAFCGNNDLPLMAGSVTGHHQILMINLMPLFPINCGFIQYLVNRHQWYAIRLSLPYPGLFLSRGYSKNPGVSLETGLSS